MLLLFLGGREEETERDTERLRKREKERERESAHVEARNLSAALKWWCTIQIMSH